MKKLLTLAVILLTLAARAQEPDYPIDTIQFFDHNWKQVKERKAIYLLRISQLADSSWQYSYYNMYGPAIRIETYKDQAAKIPHGLFVWYNNDGELDSTGYFYEGQRDDMWSYPARDTAEYYEKGHLLTKNEVTDLFRQRAIPDPNFPDHNRPTPEAYYPGSWEAYLAAHLQYPRRAVINKITGNVIVDFWVEPTGKIAHPCVSQSVEISLDDEALWLIQNSHDWVPAIRGSRRVRGYKRQPFAFRLEPRL